MTEAFRAQLAGITSLVRAAMISGEGRHTMAWSMEKLPRWYGQHCQAHESRYRDEMPRLQKAVLGNLADVLSSVQSQAVEEAVLDRFRLLSERFARPGPRAERAGRRTAISGQPLPFPLSWQPGADPVNFLLPDEDDR
jgi:hypothetical protein